MAYIAMSNAEESNERVEDINKYNIIVFVKFYLCDPIL